MKTIVNIKDKQCISVLNLEDGTYNISINKRCDDKTVKQIKGLWATIDDISEKLYGDRSGADLIYHQILHMAGQRTEKMVIEEIALNDFRKVVKSIEVKSREVVNGKPMCVCDVCLVGVSEMSKKEVTQVIDSCVRYALECGVDPQIGKDENDYR